MNLNNFTIKAQEIIQQAQQDAFNHQNPNIETVHLLKALLDDNDGPISYLLKKNNVNIGFVQGKLSEEIGSYQPYKVVLNLHRALVEKSIMLF